MVIVAEAVVGNELTNQHVNQTYKGFLNTLKQTRTDPEAESMAIKLKASSKT